MKEQQLQENQEIKKKKYGLKFFMFFLILLTFFFIYIRYMEPHFIVTHEFAIKDMNLPNAFDGLKIVHFSDLLYGSTIHEKDLKKIVNKINILKPDVIVFTGDLFSEHLELEPAVLDELITQLSLLQATFKKYAVLGNEDFLNKNAFLTIMEQADFQVLDNSHDFLYYSGNDPLLFIGTSSFLLKENDVEKAIFTNNESLDTYYKIWLSHEPMLLNLLQEKEIYPSLFLAGHTLGGLVKIPFQNTLFSNEDKDSYNETIYSYPNGKMYISSGLGTDKKHIRFLNAPSIHLYRLYKE